MTEGTRIRASSWQGLFDCAYRWEAEQLLGMRQSISHAMALGTALHKGTALFDQAKVDGNPISASTAADVFVDTLWHPTEDMQRRPNDESLQTCETRGLIVQGYYCRRFHDREYAAVELAVEPLEVEASNGHVITLTGTLDRSRVRQDGRELGITDLKSGKGAVKADGSAKVSGHQFQLGVYEMLAEHALGIPVTAPAEVIGLRTSNYPAVGEGTIDAPRRGLIGTDSTPGLIDMAASMLQSGLFPPNPASMFCSQGNCVRWDSCSYHA